MKILKYLKFLKTNQFWLSEGPWWPAEHWNEVEPQPQPERSIGGADTCAVVLNSANGLFLLVFISRPKLGLEIPGDPYIGHCPGPLEVQVLHQKKHHALGDLRSFSHVVKNSIFGHIICIFKTKMAS